MGVLNVVVAMIPEISNNRAAVVAKHQILELAERVARDGEDGLQVC